MDANAGKKMALCGVMAALAVVLMCMGTLIPLATFACPMLCMVILSFVSRITGTKMAWSWYICVSLLSLLLAPDKEAAAVFVFLGYYPIVKPKIEMLKFPALWKLLLFNGSIFVMYTVLIYLFGMAQIASEFAEMGTVLSVVTLILGNLCMIFLDSLLTRVGKMK